MPQGVLVGVYLHGCAYHGCRQQAGAWSRELITLFGQLSVLSATRKFTLSLLESPPPAVRRVADCRGREPATQAPLGKLEQTLETHHVREMLSCFPDRGVRVQRGNSHVPCWKWLHEEASRQNARGSSGRRLAIFQHEPGKRRRGEFSEMNDRGPMSFLKGCLLGQEYTKMTCRDLRAN